MRLARLARLRVTGLPDREVDLSADLQRFVPAGWRIAGVVNLVQMSRSLRQRLSIWGFRTTIPPGTYLYSLARAGDRSERIIAHHQPT